MTVHFIGAGPGAPDLVTVRGLRLIEQCPVCLYAGSLVPHAILGSAPPGAQLIDTAPLTLDEIVAHMSRAHEADLDVARLHSGDPSLYGAIAEQMRRLTALGIPYDVTPGVPSFAAAAAALGRELTLPDIAQTVILTRTATRSSPMPEGEALGRLAASGATLAIHLSAANLAHVVRALTPVVGRLVCLAGGTFVGDGKPAEVLANPAVREVFLGTEVTTSLAGPLAADGDEPADGARDG